MKIALIHDHLIQVGGAEKVLKEMHRLWPEAPIFTLLYDKNQLGESFPQNSVKTSFLQKFPGSLKHYQWYLAFMPTATESYDLSAYDVVLSSSSAFAKGVIVHPHTLHICYCHTPTRYLWSDAQRYVQGIHSPRLVKKVLPLLLTKLRIWDQLAAARVDFFIANSHFIAKRIWRYYKRESVVIYPPVETHRFHLSEKTDNYFLTGGRLVPYKRFDIAIQAFNKLGIPLKIFGDGPELKNLSKEAKSNIEFLGRVGERELVELYQRCIAYIHPQIEDFGITAVEAMASGRPVIAFHQGGACETVIDGETGEFFDEQSWEALADTVVRHKPEKFQPKKIKEYAEKFNVERFKRELSTFIQEKYQNFSSMKLHH